MSELVEVEKFEIIAIEASESVAVNPFAEHHHAFAAREQRVVHHMHVAENVEIHIGVGSRMLFGEIAQNFQSALVFLSNAFGAAIQTIAFRPVVGKWHGQSRMQGGVETLAEAIVEHSRHQAEASRLAAHLIAMIEQESVITNLLGDGARHHLNAQFGGQIVENPYIVIAGNPSDGNARVGKFGKFSEKAHKAPRHHIAVFKPIIDDVAEEIDALSRVLDGLQPTHHAAFALAGIAQIGSPQVRVANKICVFARHCQ